MGVSNDREALRLTFNQDAELYDRVRPKYPNELFEDLCTVAGTGTGCRVLEIGCGTGQLTVPLAEQGCEVVAVDIGSEMVRMARRNLEPYPLVQIHRVTFEDWTLPTVPFDLVVSATAFHWLNPDIRVTKSVEALRQGGTVAIISTHHVAGGDDTFFTDVQPCYQRWCGLSSGAFRLPSASEIPLNTDEFDRSNRFEQTRVYRYEWEQSYSAASYCELLLTYSDHIALPTKRQTGLMNCIRELIDSKCCAVITASPILKETSKYFVQRWHFVRHEDPLCILIAQPNKGSECKRCAKAVALKVRLQKL